MNVSVGPVSSESMASFAVFARAVLHAEGPGADVPSDAARAFDGYLDEWEGAGEIPGDVTWSTSVDPELAEYLVYAFFRVSKEINDAAGDSQVVPDDAAPFYWQLVAALLDALADHGGSQAEFASHLKEFWPGDHDFE